MFGYIDNKKPSAVFSMIGHLLASILGWTFLSIGPLHLGLATLGSAIFLFVGYWLSLIKPLPAEK